VHRVKSARLLAAHVLVKQTGAVLHQVLCIDVAVAIASTEVSRLNGALGLFWRYAKLSTHACHGGWIQLFEQGV